MSGFPTSLGILSFVYGTLHTVAIIASLGTSWQLFFRRTCYGKREEWIRFSCYSNEDTKDEERRRGWVVDRRLFGLYTV
jgi:hypothetical protein